MNTYKNPEWWNDENDAAWNRVKMALKRDWDQTKHDFGGNEPDTNQSIGHTARQATGKESIPPRGETTYQELEPAHRFGYGARSQYGEDYPDWNEDLERRLAEDWRATNPSRKQTWMQDRAAIRYGWDYNHGEDFDDTDGDLEEVDRK